MPVLFAQPATKKPVMTTPLGKAVFANEDAKGTIAEADQRLAADPNNLDLLIAAARARDAVLRFDESIPMYGRAIAKAPKDVRAYRFRGHRYISTRRFQEALKDLETARKLSPTSYDVYYHLGLAQYLEGRFAKAAATYQECLNMPASMSGSLPDGWKACNALDDESRVALANWTYAALSRAGKKAEAAQLLEKFPPGMAIKENIAYYRALQFYKGAAREEDFTKSGLTGSSLMALGYPIANFALIQGDKQKACDLFRRLVDDTNWAAFGYIAAESEIKRGTCR
jgi:tetratricopeptide (TPR) repeat protein